MTQSTNKSNRTALWVIGGLVAFVMVGFLLLSVPLMWFFARAEPQVERREVSPGAELPAAQAVVIPPPRVVIATPEGGVDYETAALTNIYEQVNPSVVNVTVLNTGRTTAQEGFSPNGVDPEDFIVVSSGSGFVWDMDGHIVTNNHVVEGEEQVQVTFSDGAIAVAEVVGTDVDSDLAVLRIDPEGYHLVPVTVGNLDDVHVGIRVAAIGNPFGLEGTLTSGIVSAVGRSIPAGSGFSIPDSIQTDAAINPGNSGGPLLNERGELIGVNAQIRSSSRSNSGVGFAIPVNVVARVAPALISSGKYTHSFMGISGGTLSPLCAEALGVPKTLRGALVLDVRPGTPADKAGLPRRQSGRQHGISRHLPGPSGR